jgi:hypothetical protein
MICIKFDKNLYKRNKIFTKIKANANKITISKINLHILNKFTGKKEIAVLGEKIASRIKITNSVDKRCLLY